MDKDMTLTKEWLSKRKVKSSTPQGRILAHALSSTSLNDALFDSSTREDLTHFSIELQTMPVCNQRRSGRCWIFAGLNLLREIIGAKIGCKNLELSQNYLSTFDKIEKANFALNSVLELLKKGEKPSDRLLSHVLAEPVGDGGQWDMFVNLVCKYGLLPSMAYYETAQSNETAPSNFLLNQAIREFAYKAHSLLCQGKDPTPLYLETRDKIADMLFACFGFPPESFDFAYEDKDGAYHRESGLIPLAFFEKYVGRDYLLSFQSLIHSPTLDKPYMHNFTIDYLGNVKEGRPINHLNLPMERIKEVIVACLKDGLPVWFGSDVSFYRGKDLGYWKYGAFDYETAFGFKPDFDKAAMLDFKASAMNHAMLITGVDLVDGKPAKWKIENSWGKDNGVKDGYYTMDAEWFDRFVYQAVVPGAYLNEEEKEAAVKEPTHLPPWDPMGTLAD